MNRYFLSQWIDKVIQYGILAVWIFLPLAFGSVHTWAYESVEIAVWTLVGLWGISAALNTHGVWRMGHGAAAGTEDAVMPKPSYGNRR